jgi:non-specific serine/threonine protein kinase/serine/threonine-protein kinase
MAGVPAPPPPDAVGSYRILGVIGRGGMGMVYRAEQANPKRLVALKVIGLGFVTPDLVRRFELEAAVLGRLRHPGIAQVYEAGTADLGDGRTQPFFAMELIEDAKPLDRFAADRKLDTRQRLELLAKVCDAVQHAHQHGVVHRDLKPDNILVTPDGQPKVLDFGVARLTEADVQAATLSTHAGQIIGTLPYMSPEQAGGLTDEVDTRTDVYALGVIGYELLAGRRPYDLERAALAEAVRVIREVEPSRLSSVNRTFRGDVETIIGKALSKERDRRYSTASDLAADLRRYLGDQPIEARPPSAWYQLTKFSRRNRALVIGAAATLAAIIAGAVATAFFAVEADRQRGEAVAQRGEAERQRADAVAQRAEAVAQRNEAEARRADAERNNAIFMAMVRFTLNDVFAGITPDRMPDRGLRDELVRRMLDPAVAAARARYQDDPGTRSAILNQIANTYMKLGRVDDAIKLLEEAIPARREAFGGDHVQVERARCDLVTALCEADRFTEAEPIAIDALARLRAMAGEDDDATVHARTNYGNVLLRLGRPAEAEPLLRAAAAARLKVYGPDHDETLAARARHADALVQTGRAADGLAILRDLYERRGRQFGPDAASTIDAQSMYGEALFKSDPAASERTIRDAVDRSARVRGELDQATIKHRELHAGTLHEMGRLGEAADVMGQAYRGRERTLGADHPATRRARYGYGVYLGDAGRRAEAAPVLREAYDDRARRLGPDHIDTLTAGLSLVTTLTLGGRAAEAVPLIDDLLARSRAALGPRHGTTIDLRCVQAKACVSLGRWDDAAVLYRDLLPDLIEREGGGQTPLVAASQEEFGTTMFRLNRGREAEAQYRAALATRLKLGGENTVDSIRLTNNLAASLEIQQRYADAEPLSRKAVALGAAHPSIGPSHPMFVLFASRHARILDALGRADEARRVRGEFSLPDPSTQPSTAPASRPATRPAPSASRPA